jgi:hypothetical protein
MKNITYLAIFCILVLTFASCKNKKNAAATSPANYTQQQTPPAGTTATQAAPPPVHTAATAPKEEGVMRCIVSFYSTGQGIDGKTKDEFVKFLDSYPKKITYTPTRWGREGETDFCLALGELSSPEQADFLKKANEILNKSKLVHTKENAKCDHNNWPAPTPPVTPPAEDSYRLVVEFFSIGQGIDIKANDEFVKFLNTYIKKIEYTPTHWGREGEVDYCLKLSELSTLDQANFVKKTKEILSSSKLVHINENAKCVHKH